MHIIFIIIAALIIIGLILFFRRTRIASDYLIKVSDIPDVLSQLQRTGKDGSFAVLIFGPPNSKDDEEINLQYSIEGGKVGLDWVLLGAPNIADRDRIKVFASGLGHEWVEKEMNRVRYLRVTGPGISELGMKIILDFYHVPSETDLTMITEGFDWQRKQ